MGMNRTSYTSQSNDKHTRDLCYLQQKYYFCDSSKAGCFADCKCFHFCWNSPNESSISKSPVPFEKGWRRNILGAAQMENSNLKPIKSSMANRLPQLFILAISPAILLIPVGHSQCSYPTKLRSIDLCQDLRWDSYSCRAEIADEYRYPSINFQT